MSSLEWGLSIAVAGYLMNAMALAHIGRCGAELDKWASPDALTGFAIMGSVPWGLAVWWLLVILRERGARAIDADKEGWK